MVSKLIKLMMETLKPLSDFFLAIEKDARISITHIGVYAALLEYWKAQEFRNPMTVFSYDIMSLAKISTRATYFKCIRDLNEFGYVSYEPSFNRNSASKIHFIKND